MAQYPIPVVIISSLTQHGSQLALRALDLGACQRLERVEMFPGTGLRALRALAGKPTLRRVRVGTAFGPIMLVWFLTIAILGALEIAHAPEILGAINPWHGVRFFAAHGSVGFLVLGSVVLAVTGAEALYADMGHFGRGPIRIVWFRCWTI